MIIKVLTENTALSGDFLCEHGLSLYIETGEHKILFDMGQSDIFTKNARTLGVDLKKVDIGILSHGHYDHGGGLEAFLKLNSKARVYINQNAFGDYYSTDGRYLGINKELGQSNRLILTGDEFKIDDKLFLFTGNKCERKHHMGTFGLLKKQGEEMTHDDFCHEQYLVISEGDKNILISGCSHKGILNIMDWTRDKSIDACFGGFHFKKLDVQKDSEYLHQTAKKLLEKGTKFYTCHCTGTEQYECLKEIMNNSLEYIQTGTTIKL